MNILLKLKKAAILILMLHILGAAVMGCIFVMKGKTEKTTMVMGAVLLKDKLHNDQQSVEKLPTTEENNERFFRPSKLIALNTKDDSTELINKYFDTKEEYIELPKEYFKNPWDTVINYYSVLREAEYMEKDKLGGCGTVGWGKKPFPIAYSHLSKDYREKTSFGDYVESFKGISHINLIKLRNITDTEMDKNKIKYFIETEVLRVSEKGYTYFGYYYGYVNLIPEDGGYKISNIELYGEDFLCAAYHGWRQYAEAYVMITYGNWCKLVEKRLPTVQEGYVKNIDIKGTDGKEYRFQFIQLTNGVDIEVGQYVKDKDNSWKVIKINPEECLENR